MKMYHLKWSSHIPNMETVFTTLFESEGLADVSIMCQNGSLRAHRIILSTCSNYFLRLFLDVSTKRPIITVPEVTMSTMKDLLAFIYTGEVQVAEEKLEELLQAAEMLEIRGLTGGKGEEGHEDAVTPKKEAAKILELSADLLEIKENLPKELPCVHSTSSTQKKSPLVSPNVNDQQLAQHNKIQSSRESPIPEITIMPVPEVTTTTSSPSSHKEVKKVGLSPKRTELDDNSSMMDVVQEKHDEMEDSFAYPEMSSPYQSSAYSQQSAMSLLNGNVSPALLHQDDVSKIMTQVSFPTCPICAKDCANLPNLRSHLQTHLQGKPFSCEFCDAKFSRASHLCRHRRTHTGEKPFTCSKCGKTFSRQDKLKTHADRHLTEDSGMMAKKKQPKGARRNSFSPSQQQQQQQEEVAAAAAHVQSSLDSRPWNNVAFPGFSNPYFPPQIHDQNHHHHHHQQMNDMFAQRFNGQVNGNSIISSLMKLGDCSVLQVPK